MDDIKTRAPVQAPDIIISAVTVHIEILKRGPKFGYIVAVGDDRVTGWSTSEGQLLHSSLHAWRTALKRAKNQGLRAPGLTV